MSYRAHFLAFILKGGFCFVEEGGWGSYFWDSLSRQYLSEARPKIGPMSSKIANFHGRVSIG